MAISAEMMIISFIGVIQYQTAKYKGVILSKLNETLGFYVPSFLYMQIKELFPL